MIELTVKLYTIEEKLPKDFKQRLVIWQSGIGDFPVFDSLSYDPENECWDTPWSSSCVHNSKVLFWGDLSKEISKKIKELDIRYD